MCAYACVGFFELGIEAESPKSVGRRGDGLGENSPAEGNSLKFSSQKFCFSQKLLLLLFMKFFHIILSIYMLTLSLVPCNDVEKDVSTDQDSIEMIADHDAEKDSCGDHQDLCTPFCTCNCCASGAAVLFSTYRISSYLLSISKKEPVFIETAISNYTLSFWQPPKV